MDCQFPSSNGWSKTIYDYHIVTACVGLPIAFFLFSDVRLRRFYYPLAAASKAAILLELLGSFWYLVSLPENFEQLSEVQNCGEIFMGRLQFAMTIFGEMHMVYFLSKALGVGVGNNNHYFVFGRGISITLSQALLLALFAAVVSVFLCVFYRRVYGTVRNVLVIAVVVLQYQQIQMAKGKSDDDCDSLISSNDAAVTMFEKFTLMQICASVFSLAQRLIYKPYFPAGIARLNNSRMIIDYFVTLVFYLKVLLIKEKANVEVIVDQEQQR